MSKSLREARARVLKTPGWGTRLIENEERAVRKPRFAPITQLTGRRSDAVFEAVSCGHDR